MPKLASNRLFLAFAALAAALLPAQSFCAPGDLYVADASSRTILRVTPDGTITTFATDFLSPGAIAFDRRGNLFVADADVCVTGGGGPCEFPSRIYRLTPTGEKSIFVSLPANTPVFGMAIDGAGNLLVSVINAILKFAPDGTQSTFAVDSDGFWALAFDKLGTLYVGTALSAPAAIAKLAPNGARSTFVLLPASNSATSLAFDAMGNLFSRFGSAILKIAPNGSISTFASGNFTYPLAFDEQGNLFAAFAAYNAGEPAIVKFTPAGVRTTFVALPMAPYGMAFEPVVEKLRNLSARGFVQTGDNVLVAGFIVGGNALANNSVLLRAIGPSLAHAGIAQPLSDPTLELRDTSGGLIASNDNWQATQRAEIEASGLAPTDSHEAAILATLPAGPYTAIVRGVGGGTGVSLVEVYSVNQ